MGDLASPRNIAQVGARAAWPQRLQRLQRL